MLLSYSPLPDGNSASSLVGAPLSDDLEQHGGAPAWMTTTTTSTTTTTTTTNEDLECVHWNIKANAEKEENSQCCCTLVENEDENATNTALGHEDNKDEPTVHGHGRFRSFLHKLWYYKKQKKRKHGKNKAKKLNNNLLAKDFDDTESLVTLSTACSSACYSSLCSGKSHGEISSLCNESNLQQERHDWYAVETTVWEQVQDDQGIAGIKTVWLAYNDHDATTGVETIDFQVTPLSPNDIQGPLSEIGRSNIPAIDDTDISSVSSCVSLEDFSIKHAYEGDKVPLMQQRLEATGLVTFSDDYDFVTDHVSKEMIGLDNLSPLEEEPNDLDQDFIISHVKTGIWQVICFDAQNQEQPPVYVVTGVKMEQRVDTKKLRKAVMDMLQPRPQGDDQQRQQQRKPKLHLAPTEIAQDLAGYRSGTMAPICHTTNMPLFMEESIFLERGRGSNHRIRCGSGLFGQCLSIGADKFLAIAARTSVQAVPLIQTKKKSSNSDSSSSPPKKGPLKSHKKLCPERKQQLLLQPAPPTPRQ